MLALLLTAACRQMIGIEDAELDPTLTAGASSGAPDASAPPAVAGADGGGGATGSVGEAGAAGSAGEAGAAGSAGAPSLCDRYCALVAENCRDRFAVYTSDAACRAVCERLPAGAEDDGDVNSVHCRLRAARAAPDEVPHYCPIAGPGGNGVCGSNCEGLCALRSAACGADESACLSECSALEDLGQYSTSVDAQQYTGAHVQCRLYHVSAAPLSDTEKHCSHAAGSAPCN